MWGGTLRDTGFTSAHVSGVTPVTLTVCTLVAVLAQWRLILTGCPAFFDVPLVGQWAEASGA